MELNKINKVLSIAGSDSSGGAGIQADIKTIIANGCYAMTAITAITAQNTLGVTGIMGVTPDILEKQLDAVFTDIMPDAVKIGMVFNKELVSVISDSLTKYNAKNVVLDPVMISTSGSKLIDDDAISVMTSKLFNMATVITPNIPEASFLTDMEITNKEEMEKAARVLADKFNVAVLLKGGHSINDANDYLVWGNNSKWFDGERINTTNTHGTGCTLSSAIASNLANGFSIDVAVENAKEYLRGALKNDINIGHGSGPVNHGWNLK